MEFNITTAYRLNSFLDEIKHGTLGNETYSNRADTYGLMLSIDRRLLAIGSK